MAKATKKSKEKPFYDYTKVLVDDLIPYVNNSRTHSPEQVSQIAASIKEFGFTNPVLVDDDKVIIAGHGRVLAAQKLKMAEVPAIILSGLTETQKKAYVLADNQLALNAGWDTEKLKLELEALKDADFDTDLLGFDEDFLKEIEFEADDYSPDGSNYSRKIEAPIYEPTDEQPSLSSLVDRTKTTELVNEIQDQLLPDDIKEFLITAAFRHDVFDFRAIAQYYAHAPDQIKTLMEKSALVIIDFDAAIENGYVEMTEKMAALHEA